MGETIIVWLAQGAVAFVGGKAMGEIIGDPLLSNIEEVVRRAVNEINQFTRRAIEENEIRKLIASTAAVKRNLSEYSRFSDKADQEDNSFLLQDAILKTSDIISQCQSLGVDAVLCYVNAVSLNIISKTAYYQLNSTNERAANITGIINEAQDYLRGLIPPFIASLQASARLRIPDPPCRWERSFDGHPNVGRCWLIIDGNEVEVHNGIEMDSTEVAEMHNRYWRDYNAVHEKAKSEIRQPIINAISSWQSIPPQL